LIRKVLKFALPAAKPSCRVRQSPRSQNLDQRETPTMAMKFRSQVMNRFRNRIRKDFDEAGSGAFRGATINLHSLGVRHDRSPDIVTNKPLPDFPRLAQKADCAFRRDPPNKMEATRRHRQVPRQGPRLRFRQSPGEGIQSVPWGRETYAGRMRLLYDIVSVSLVSLLCKHGGRATQR